MQLLLPVFFLDWYRCHSELVRNVRCAQVANPDSLTILIDGDGSFGMTNMDLQTVKRPPLELLFYARES